MLSVMESISMDGTYWNGFFLPLVFYDWETLVNPPGLWVFLVLFDLCIDDHGSLIIFRSASNTALQGSIATAYPNPCVSELTLVQIRISICERKKAEHLLA
jgi:hypothetical protein